MASKYKNSSVYRNTRINKYFLDLYEPPIIPDLENYKTITLDSKYNYRPDLLAYDLYGQSELWWVFALYNRDLIKNPIYDFKSGIQIKIPKNISDIGY